MPDMRKEQRAANRPPREYEFVGTHPGLINGEFYTIRQIAIIAGVHNKTMHSRMRGKTIITDKTMSGLKHDKGSSERVSGEKFSRFDSLCEKVSDQFLRKLHTDWGEA